MNFVIIDRFGNLFGPFDSPADATYFAKITMPEDSWEMKPVRSPSTLAEGER